MENPQSEKVALAQRFMQHAIRYAGLHRDFTEFREWYAKARAASKPSQIMTHDPSDCELIYQTLDMLYGTDVADKIQMEAFAEVYSEKFSEHYKEKQDPKQKELEDLREEVYRLREQNDRLKTELLWIESAADAIRGLTKGIEMRVANCCIGEE